MKILASVLGLIALFALRSTVSDWFSNSFIPKATTSAASCLALAGSTTSEEDGHTFIIGNIRNNCDHKVGSVTVSFKLDRPPGPQQPFSEGIAYAYARDVAPGETRRFKTAVMIPKRATYHFDKINAF
jgi:hypothetical protein